MQTPVKTTRCQNAQGGPPFLLDRGFFGPDDMLLGDSVATVDLPPLFHSPVSGMPNLSDNNLIWGSRVIGVKGPISKVFSSLGDLSATFGEPWIPPARLALFLAKGATSAIPTEPVRVRAPA